MGNKMEEKKEKIGFFQEEENVWSHTRLMSTGVFFLLIAINFWVLKWSYYSTHSYDSYFVSFMVLINLIFLISIFYPKYLKQVLELGVSKFQQVKNTFSQTIPSTDKE